MRKHVLVLLFFFACFSKSSGQNPEIEIKKIETIFKGYVDRVESMDSDENKAQMKNALMSLQVQRAENHFPILIDVWMYYDPTDFPTRELIEPILQKNKSAALLAIGTRLKNKRASESLENAPYIDLINFRQKLLE